MPAVRTALASAGALALSLLALAPAPAAAQTAPAPAGAFADARGVIVDLTVLTAVELPGVLGSTALDPNTFATASRSCPPQPADAGTDVLLDADASPAARADTVRATATVDCSKPTSVAVAQTEGATALVNAGVPLISADVIRAQANSSCDAAPDGDGSQFVGLRVNGQEVPLGPLGVPEPNTRIEIPGIATVIVNEQHPTADGRGIVVNGVHVIGASPLLRGDLVLSHAVSGVVCPNGKGSEVAAGLDAPDIAFDKDASPSTARAGETVTYTATVRNTSTEPCDVISFFDHLSPAFELVSTSGGFGDAAQDPAPTRQDGGQDVVLRPTDVVIAPGASVTQQIVVRVKDETPAGTYFNNLEIFCAVNGNFASGPLAPVTVPAEVVAGPPPAEPAAPVAAPAPAPAPQLPATGGAPVVAAAALLLAGAGIGIRRVARG